MLLYQEEGPCGDEQPKAHAPEMAHDALGTEDAAVHEHANVPCRSKQHHRAHEKVHPNGNSSWRLRVAIPPFKPKNPEGSPAQQGISHASPTKKPLSPVSAPGGHP